QERQVTSGGMRGRRHPPNEPNPLPATQNADPPTSTPTPTTHRRPATASSIWLQLRDLSNAMLEPRRRTTWETERRKEGGGLSLVLPSLHEGRATALLLPRRLLRVLRRVPLLRVPLLRRVPSLLWRIPLLRRITPLLRRVSLGRVALSLPRRWVPGRRVACRRVLLFSWIPLRWRRADGRLLLAVVAHGGG
uniref:Uncharacterized protein n=1 Tax=Aegilops tauschii subsp. strangulata TaxID=200361 RepID=A0A453SL09_AEGTS